MLIFLSISGVISSFAHSYAYSVLKLSLISRAALDCGLALEELGDVKVQETICIHFGIYSDYFEARNGS